MSADRRRPRIDGIRTFEARVFPDERGFLLQSYVRSELEKLGVPGEFRQAIQSRSCRGVVRGLHFQWNPPQGKLIRCVTGRIWDVVVDIRHGSPTVGCHHALEMTGDNRRVLWVPPGFAHGFMALENDTIALYECTTEWSPASEGGILWNDPELGIEWPAIEAMVSEKDRRNPPLAEWLANPTSKAFRWEDPAGSKLQAASSKLQVKGRRERAEGLQRCEERKGPWSDQ